MGQISACYCPSDLSQFFSVIVFWNLYNKASTEANSFLTDNKMLKAMFLVSAFFNLQPTREQLRILS